MYQDNVIDKRDGSGGDIKDIVEKLNKENNSDATGNNTVGYIHNDDNDKYYCQAT